MAQELANALEGRLTTLIWASAALALIIVATVALTWWMGWRIVHHRGGYWNSPRLNTFRRGDESLESNEDKPPGTAHPRAPDEEAWASRLVRDTAQRAATLRDTWERSYRAARTPAEPSEGGGQNLADVANELLRQQQITNTLLRELLDRHERPAE